MICPEETEPARTDRDAKPAGARAPAVKATRRPNPREGLEETAVGVPAREKAAAVAADRDRAAVKAADAARTGNDNPTNHEGGTTSCQDLTEVAPWAPAR
jgi:hypothetical protein